MKKTQQPPSDGRNWKPVPGYDRFFASDDGQIWSGAGGVIKAQRGVGKRSEYRAIVVYDSKCKNKDKGRPVKVHQLVALAFYGEPPSSKYTVDHINRDQSDNRASNLRWACPTAQALNRDDALSIQRRCGLIAKNIELLAMHEDFSNVFLDLEISILEKAMLVVAGTAEQ